MHQGDNNMYTLCTSVGGNVEWLDEEKADVMGEVNSVDIQFILLRVE